MTKGKIFKNEADMRDEMTEFVKLEPMLACNVCDYVVLDFETTGLSNNDEIVEVGCIRIRDGSVTKTFQTLVKPTFPIPYRSTLIHGITNADVEKFPGMEQVLPKLLSFIKTDVVVAYNADFDMRFLKNAMKKYPCEDRRVNYMDALSVVKEGMPGLPSYRLQSVREYMGLPSNHAHRALDDVLITFRVFENCKNKVNV